MDAVRFEDFSYHYPKTGKGLNRVMLAIPTGSFTVLTGANGSGKTTLCMAMTGLVPHFFGGSMSGRVLVDGQETTGRQVADIAAGVGLVMEDYESQLVALTVFDEVAFALENMAVPPELIRERVLAALASVGLAGLEERELSALSGGQKQRLAVASVLASQPKLLVLDEPTSAMDPEGAGELYALLAQLNREQGITVVVADHDLARALPYADGVVVMAGGSVVLTGAPNEVFPQMLNQRIYAVAVPALRRLKAAMEADGTKFSAWMTAEEAAVEIDACLDPVRRLSLSA
ncbi:MAG: energy-coupling factor ABC transporter ATP-binding protein [Negativicutes bacterium]